MEQHQNTTQATVEALTELLKLNAARFEATHAALLELQKTSAEQYQVMQQVLHTIEHTRVYRLLQRLGRWKFMEQGRAAFPPGVAWSTGDPCSPSPQLPSTQSHAAYKTAIDALQAAQPNKDMLDRIRAHNHCTIDDMHTICPLQGRLLLDIGASAWGYALERALEHGAALYVGVDLEMAQPQYVLGDSGNVGLLLKMDAASLQLPSRMFDVVISSSTFEHFTAIDVVLSEIERVLKGGGLALITFDGVWSCSYGHHLLHFGECANLVPPWAHLVWTPEQMLQALAPTWPESAPLSAEQAVQWIYTDPALNRLNIRQIRAFLDDCSLDIKWLVEHKEEGFDQTALHIAAAVTGLSPDELMIRGLSVLLEKRAETVPLQQQGEDDKPLDFDACYAQIREPKKRQWVDCTPEVEDRIVQQLRLLGQQVSDYEIDVEDYRRYVAAARYAEDFPHYYPTNLPEKSLEHYIATQLLQLNAQDVYIDIASEHSPVPDIYRRLFAATAYRQDLAYPPGLHEDKIGCDAAHMPLPEAFATKMALHCSFEHFEGDSDIGFIRETARVLRPGGAACIVPLYLFEEYAIQTDPVLALPAGVVFDDDATVYCAQGWNNRYGRVYSPERLVSRVCKNASNLHIVIYRVTNAQQVDPSCYVRFAMLLQKPE